MRETIKCLTIRQPWAYLIINGHKDIENRSWSTRYRGPLVIQSARSYGSIAELSDLCLDIEEETGIALPDTFTLGVTEGIVTLQDIITTSQSIWAYDGDYHWILTDPAPLPAVRLSGKLGIWDLSLKSINNPETVSRIREYLTRYK